MVLPQYADSRNSVRKHINYKKYMKKLEKTNDIDELIACMEINFRDKLRRKIRYYLGCMFLKK